MTLPDEGLTIDGSDMGDLADFGDFGDFGGVEGVDELNDAIQFRVVAVLPGHIEDSNADEVDGDTAVWTISMLSPPTEMLFASASSTLSSKTHAVIVFFCSSICARKRRWPVRISYLSGSSVSHTTIGCNKPIFLMLAASSSMSYPKLRTRT